MKKTISLILTVVLLNGLTAVNASPHDNFESAEFSKYENVQITNGGFIVTKDDKNKIYYDKYGNETDDIVSVAGGNVFYIESENKAVNEYNPETGTGSSYTVKYYYIYDNNNNLIEKLPSDKYDIREIDGYIITANHDDNIENIDVKFYFKETGELISELSASEYMIGNTFGENSVFDISYLSLSKSGYFVFTDKNGLCGVSDIYKNIILEPKYQNLLMMDYENDYFTARSEDKIRVIDKTGNIIKETDFYNISKLYDENGKNYYAASDADYMNYLLDENFNEIKMPDRMEFSGFLDEGKTLIKVMRPIIERPSTYDVNEAVVDLQGNVIIPFEKKLSNIKILGDNFISAHMLDNYYHFVIFDRSGNIIVENCNEITEAGDNGFVGVYKDGKSFYIDKDGKTILYPPEGYTVQGIFSEGLASVVKTDTIAYSNYGRTAYIDETGKIVIEGDENWCRGYEFENGIAVIGLDLGKGGPTRSTYVKFTGKMPSSWAEDMVDRAKEIGVVTDESVYYKLEADRETFCELVYNTIDAVMDIEWEKPVLNPFKDTENEKVIALNNLGIIEGKGDGFFAPDDSLTREEAATIVLRIGRFLNIENNHEKDDSAYADDSDISDWAKDAVYELRHLGIMQGTDLGFEPKAHYTFEESVVTLMRLYNLIGVLPNDHIS